MRGPAFVLHLATPAPRTLTRSSVWGRPVSAKFSIRPSARVSSPFYACAPAADPAPETQTDEPVESSAAEVPASEIPAADDGPEAQETATVEATAGSVDSGQDEAAEDSGDDDDAEQESEPTDKPKPERRRRRRPRQRREVTLPLETMEVGMELEGVVKSVMDYGAFIGDMGTPTDGLLHVSQLGSGFVENVSDVVKIGDKLKVRVLNVDLTRGNFSLTTKTPEQLESRASARKEAAKEAAVARKKELDRKWDSFSFDPEQFIEGKVMSVTDFGAFCKLIDESGEPRDYPTDGLIHISELSDQRVAKVTDVLEVGQVVNVRVVGADRKRNRISLSMREYRMSAEESASSVAMGMAEAEKHQPTFKTSFQLAFEKAEASTSQ